MKKKIIIALVVIVAIGGLIYARQKAIQHYSTQTAIAEQKGDYANAVKSFNKVVLLSPRTESAYLYRARLYFNNGNTNEAIEDLSTVLKMDKGNAEAHFGLGLIRLQEGDLEKAVKELSAAIKGKPAKERLVEAYLSRSVAYRKLGEKDKAQADVEKALKLDPKNEAAKNAIKIFE